MKSEMVFWLDKFPLAPSVNKYLMPVAGKYKISKTGRAYRAGHMVKTRDHLNYANECILWYRQHRKYIDPIFDQLNTHKKECEYLKQTFSLEVQCYFSMTWDKLLSIDNKAKNGDVDNKLKPTLDNLFKLIGIDDKVIFKASCEKILANSKESEWTTIMIKTTNLRTYEQIKEQMKMAI